MPAPEITPHERKLSEVFQGAGDVAVHVARIRVLVEDLRLESSAAPELQPVPSIDTTSKTYRYVYFLRRMMVSLDEFCSAVHQINASPEGVAPPRPPAHVPQHAVWTFACGRAGYAARGAAHLIAGSAIIYAAGLERGEVRSTGGAFRRPRLWFSPALPIGIALGLTVRTRLGASRAGRAAHYHLVDTPPGSVEFCPLLALVIEEGCCGELPRRPGMTHELRRFVGMRARSVTGERLGPIHAGFSAGARPLCTRLL